MARPIKAGDTARVMPGRISPEMLHVYGARAEQPFLVEQIVRGGRYIVVRADGMLFWRKDCQRVRTK